MRYGPVVAEKYRKQYCKQGKWSEYPSWGTLQPAKIHLILGELSSKEAVDALIGNRSWTHGIGKKKLEKFYAKAEAVTNAAGGVG